MKYSCVWGLVNVFAVDGNDFTLYRKHFKAGGALTVILDVLIINIRFTGKQTSLLFQHK